MGGCSMKCPKCGSVCTEEELVFKEVKCLSWICPKCDIRIVSKEDAIRLDEYNEPDDKKNHTSDEIDDMDPYIIDYHISHGCNEHNARFLAWMNSNWTETNGYFVENKDRLAYGYEVFNSINEAITNLVKDKKKKGIKLGHFEIMEGLYREMHGRYDQYRTKELQEIDMEKIRRVVCRPDIKWWELP